MDKTTTSDFGFFRKVMPSYYVTIDSSLTGSRPEKIRCRSNFGVEDKESWEYLMKAFRQRWGDRFIEVNHTVNTNHTDFTIYLKAEE